MSCNKHEIRVLKLNSSMPTGILIFTRERESVKKMIICSGSADVGVRGMSMDVTTHEKIACVAVFVFICFESY